MTGARKYQACYHCDLLFEVDTGALAPCPRCRRQLTAYTPDDVPETDETPICDWDESSDSHTRLIAILPRPGSATGSLVGGGTDETPAPSPDLTQTAELPRDAYGLGGSNGVLPKTDPGILRTPSPQSLATQRLARTNAGPARTAALEGTMILGDRRSGKQAGQAPSSVPAVSRKSSPRRPDDDDDDDDVFGEMDPTRHLDEETGHIAAVPRMAVATTGDPGPDPTPRQRTAKGRRPQRPSTQQPQRPKRTIDQAMPRPLDSVDSPSKGPPAARPVDARADTEPKFAASQGGVHEESTLFSPSSGAKVPDAIASLVDEIMNESMDEPSVLQAPRARKGISRSVLVFLLATTAIALGGGIALIMTRPNVSKGTVENPAVPGDRLQAVMTQLGVRPLPVQNVPAIRNQPFLILGTEAAVSSAGPIQGLTSATAILRQTEVINGKTVSTPVLNALKTQVRDEAFLIGLEPRAAVRELTVLGQSVLAAGFPEVALVVERAADGRLGGFPFAVGAGKIPAAGHASIRIGQLGVYTEILGRDGLRLSPDLPPIARLDGGRIDLASLDARLESLSQGAPLVRLATVTLDGKLSISETMSILRRVKFGPEKERFTSIRLVVQ